jgi:rhodanese-related sulfurtransferase
MRGVVASKFVPGLGNLAPPLAGNSGVSAPRFLFFDGLGSLLYAGGFILVGVLFSHQLDRVIGSLTSLGSKALGLVAGLAAVYIACKYFQRHRLLNELRMTRITVDELHQMQEAGEKPIILDLRSLEELQQNASIIRGARHTTMEELALRAQELPRDRDIILYCSCPNEISSARMALQLRRKGFNRVRPLLGGFDAWRDRNYPTEPRVVAPA